MWDYLLAFDYAPMTTTYYVPPQHINGNIASLPDEEAHHAVHVLRHKAGDHIVAVDGAGGWYRIVLTATGRKVAVGEIVEKQENVGEPEFGLTIAIAVLKNQKRFDTFVEKAVELGVTRIIPMTTSRVEKKTVKADRIQKILIAAMKQCGRSRLVSLDPVTAFSNILLQENTGLSLCCHEKADTHAAFTDTLLEWKDRREALIFIGPEGGFTDQEIALAQGKKARIVSLGKRRLRAETAAIVASTGVSLLW